MTGCLYQCIYCYSRRLAEGRLRHLPRYRNGFKPQLIEAELSKRFDKSSSPVFVSSMGDLFGEWVPASWIEKVLAVVRSWSQTQFMLLTKNPGRYQEFNLPPNVIAGATMESTYVEPGISKAPKCWERYVAMAQLRHPRKFVSIEPIMDFNSGDGPESLAGWLRDIGPEFVYLGYDNWGASLPEPSLDKVKALIEALRAFTEVRVKTLREAING